MAKIGVIHYNFPNLVFEEFIGYVKKTGYEYVELPSGDVWDEKQQDSDPYASAEKMKKYLDSNGIKVSAVSAGNNFITLEQDEIKKQLERIRKIGKTARILGTNVLRTEGGWSKEIPEEKWADAITECLKRAAEFAETDDIYFAVDNHGYATNDFRRQIEIFRRVDSKRVGSNFDTMNYRWFGYELAELEEIYSGIAPHVIHTHMKDGRGARENYKGEALGEGEINLKHAVECLKNSNYDGVWCAEYEGKEGIAGYTKCYNWLKSNV